MYLVSDSLGINARIYKVLGLKRQEPGISKSFRSPRHNVVIFETPSLVFFLPIGEQSQSALLVFLLCV
jgi:hypothetical protein